MNGLLQSPQGAAPSHMCSLMQDTLRSETVARVAQLPGLQELCGATIKQVQEHNRLVCDTKIWDLALSPRIKHRITCDCWEGAKDVFLAHLLLHLLPPNQQTQDSRRATRLRNTHGTCSPCSCIGESRSAHAKHGDVANSHTLYAAVQALLNLAVQNRMALLPQTCHWADYN